MPNYNNSIIYKIYQLDKPEICYIGSTCNFKSRKCKHKSNCNNPNCKQYKFKIYQYIRENQGWDNFKMVPIKQVKCETKLKLRIEEQKMIDELKPQLNNVRAYRTCEQVKEYRKQYNKQYNESNKEHKKKYYESTKEHHKEQMKQYYEANKEHLNEQSKQYREANKEKVHEYNKQHGKQYREANKTKIKQYREANKEKAREYHKQYYKEYREKIKERNKIKVTCECGSIVRKSDMRRHERSKKHQAYIISV